MVDEQSQKFPKILYNEIEKLKRLAKKSIIVPEVYTVEDNLYLVTEFIEGKRLRELKNTRDTRTYYFLTANLLDLMHSAENEYHGDPNSSNFLISNKGIIPIDFSVKCKNIIHYNDGDSEKITFERKAARDLRIFLSSCYGHLECENTVINCYNQISEESIKEEMKLDLIGAKEYLNKELRDNCGVKDYKELEFDEMPEYFKYMINQKWGNPLDLIDVLELDK